VEVFEQHRDRLRSVAYRMLGSLSDADDAVQEAWLRLNRTGAGTVDDMGAWLTTVVGRICLDMLRARATRREEPLGVHVPDPIITGPEQEAVLADSVGLALLVVLDTLTPAERLAFVLHDMFAVPFDEIGRITGRSADAAKMQASRARRRVRAAAPGSGTDAGRQRRVVEAFLAAARGGDFAALVAVLHPDVVLRADGGTSRPGRVLRGAATVAEQARMFAGVADVVHMVLVNGEPGIMAEVGGEPLSVMAFTVAGDRIVQIDILVDPVRLRALRPPAR
jgi:RNA polymerase sigma factor (sigma-70 family)